MQDYIPNNYFTRSQNLSNTKKKKKKESYIGNRGHGHEPKPILNK